MTDKSQEASAKKPFLCQSCGSCDYLIIDLNNKVIECCDCNKLRQAKGDHGKSRHKSRTL